MAEKANGLLFPHSEVLTPPASRDDLILFDVPAKTELAVETLHGMGMVGDAGLARETVGQNMTSLHAALTEEGYTPDGDDLEVFQTIELPAESHAGFAFRSLLLAYENMQQAEIYRYFKLWDLYDSSEIGRRGFHRADRSEPAGGEALTSEAVGMQRRTGYNDEAGLQFVNKTRREQMGIARETIGNGSTRLVQMSIMNPVDYVMLSAQRRIEGVPPPDSNRTRTRFVQMDEKFADNLSMIPSAASHDGQLRLVGTKGSERGGEGVRLLVGRRPQR